MNKSGDLVCEICGEWADGRTYRIIEGIKMIVCKNCRDLGEQPKYSETRFSRKSSSSSQNIPRYQTNAYKPKYSPKPKLFPKKNTLTTPRVEDLDLLPDYRKIIKSKRQKLKLSLAEFAKKIGITEASYRSVEKGKIDLLIKDALKIEKIFNIKITEQPLTEDDIDLSNLIKKPGKYTLGDVVVKKGKK